MHLDVIFEFYELFKYLFDKLYLFAFLEITINAEKNLIFHGVI